MPFGDWRLTYVPKAFMWSSRGSLILAVASYQSEKVGIVSSLPSPWSPPYLKRGTQTAPGGRNQRPPKNESSPKIVSVRTMGPMGTQESLALRPMRSVSNECCRVLEKLQTLGVSVYVEVDEMVLRPGTAIR